MKTLGTIEEGSIRPAISALAIVILVGGLVVWTAAPAPIPAGQAQAQIPYGAKPPIVRAYGKLPLSFEANHGQTDPQVRFLSRGRGYTLFLAATEAVLVLNSPQSQRSAPSSPPRSDSAFSAVHSLSGIAESQTSKSTVLYLQLVGANPEPQVSGLEELPGRSNYFIGNDPAKWRTNVRQYGKVKYKGVYPGIDLVYYGTNQRQLEYDFIVAPGADPSAITLNFEGADRLELDAQGDLLLYLSDGEVRFQKPYIYQVVNGTRQEIAGRYVLESKNEVAFEVTSYDASQPLVIDPILGYSTYLGGTASDQAFAIAVDDSSNVYVTGWTNSVNFPTTVGAFQPSLTGTVNDIFVAKLNASGSALVYSTYLGGNGGDLGISIAVDAAGNAYITGNAGSLDFPTTPGAFQVTFAGSGGPGGGDAFVTKLSAAGDALVYSTYLGGSEMDRGESITADPAGNAYVTGFTNSSDFPTADALQASFGGCFACSFEGDAFVTKLSPAGTVLVYSTYLGGSGDERGFGLAVDATGNAYVTGFTTSTNFPTANALQATPGLFEDVFVAKLNATGSALTYSTYLGGGGPETGFGITLDALGNAYVTGETSSGDFPTANSFQASYGGGFRDAFVTKLNAEGSSLVYSTYLGGSDRDHGWGIAVDAAGNAYVTGMTLSMDFPTANPVQAVGGGLGGFEESFVTKLNAVGSALIYSTYLGGSNRDNFFGGGIMVDTKGNAYVTGNTPSDDFPTANPFQASLSGGTDAFVTKICGATLQPLTLTFSEQIVGTTSAEQNVTLTNLASVPLTITSIVSSGNFSQSNTCAGPLAVGGSCAISVNFTPTASGSRAEEVTITDDACGNPYSIALSGTGVNLVSRITSLVPDKVPAGSPGFTLTVNGGGFATNSVVRWNGADRVTTFVSETELQASIPASDIQATGTAEVTVFNPDPGGGISNAATFTITLRNPSPVATGLLPGDAVAGGGDFTLTVLGSNFVFNSIVRWNGGERPTTFVSRTQLQAAISAADIATASSATVTVFSPAPGGGTSNALTFAINAAPNPVPSIGSLSPGSTAVGAVRSSLLLTIGGSRFLPGSAVRWNGSNRQTKFVSSSQVDALILASDLAVAGNAQITVFTPSPGGGLSNGMTFTVNNPVPTLASISPPSIPAGSPDFIATVTGSGFVPGSVIRADGVGVVTTFVSSTQLRTEVVASDVATPDTVAVTVFTPGPGGGESNPVPFTIEAVSNPAPSISTLSPSSALAGRTGFTLTVTGSGFTFDSVVRWNGSDRATLLVSVNEVLAWIFAGDIALGGTADVTVFTPAPGGGESSPLPFTINNPVPAASALSPLAALAGSGVVALTVSGVNFVPSSVVRVNGADSPTTFVSTNQFQSFVPAANTLSPGMLSISVFTPAPGGGLSNTLTFTLVSTANPVAVISLLSPDTVTAGGAGFTLTVAGSGFIPGSVVRWNGSNRTTTFVSSTELQAAISAGNIARARSVDVTVFNPSPGGGTSNFMTVVVQ